MVGRKGNQTAGLANQRRNPAANRNMARSIPVRLSKACRLLLTSSKTTLIRAQNYHQGGAAAQPMPQPQESASAQHQGIQHLQQQMNAMRQTLPLGPGRTETQLPFPAALSMMISALDRELEVVAKAGAEAFSQKDLARADAALKFSGPPDGVSQAWPASYSNTTNEDNSRSCLRHHL